MQMQMQMQMQIKPIFHDLLNTQNVKLRHTLMESTTAEGDCGGELDSDVGVGAHGIHALDHVLDDRFNLRIIGEVQHVITLCYIIFSNAKPNELNNLRMVRDMDASHSTFAAF
jgi:hypothetical protein